MLKIDYTAQGLPGIDPAATGRNIQRLRIAAGLTVRQIQDVFGFTTPQAVYKWQRGLALPTLDNALILARLLHVSVEELIVCRKGFQEKGGDP
ncbi:MAG: helix-turn-helix transcriptional regulator [Oscillospiraceae bacterium]|nr:helix-turn-helix transcriptional regulator [Oscillospiraceae bacterium]